MLPYEGWLQAFVELLGVTAKSDKSDPPHWLLNDVLGAVERVVLRLHNDALGFASICSRARAGLPDDFNDVLLQLGEINGSRRKDDPVLVIKTRETLVSARTRIDRYPGEPRAGHCNTLWYYNSGVFDARHGEYSKAIEAHEFLAADPLTKPEDQAVSRYLVGVYAMWDALMRGAQAETEMRLNDLRAASSFLREEVRGTKYEITWGKGNGPLHMLQALMLTRAPIDYEWEGLRTEFEQARAVLGELSAPWYGVMNAVYEYARPNLIMAGEFASEVIAANKRPDTTAFARLILARVHEDRGDRKLAQEVYALIQPAPECHKIAAVAARELAALGS